MSYEKTWSGDWHSRVLERVREHGFETVTDYANDRVGVSLDVLADELGPDDIAGAQLQCLLLEEATRSNAIPRLLRDLLVRELRDRLPQGWKYPLDDRSRYEVAAAIAAWVAEFQDHLDAEGKSSARRALLAAELPPGWLPDGPDDPVIVVFVNRCLGRAPS
jgi:hypothetical protein